MSLLFVKLILAPLIVLIATLLGRRLGPRAAGLFVGLPGTALPFLLTMYLTHGPHAATTTAAGGIAGQLICATYCIVIARTGARLRPVLAALVALAVAIGVGLAALLLNNAYAVALLVLLACVAGLVTWPHDDTPRAPAHDRWWAIPTRMGLVTIMVCGIAALEPYVGTGLAGTFASLPLILVVMGVTEHRARGPLGALDLARGTLASIAGTAVFLLVVVVLNPRAGVWVALVAGLVLIPVVNRSVTALAGALSHRMPDRADGSGRAGRHTPELAAA